MVDIEKGFVCLYEHGGTRAATLRLLDHLNLLNTLNPTLLPLSLSHIFFFF